jgi:hypothetical protein
VRTDPFRPFGRIGNRVVGEPPASKIVLPFTSFQGNVMGELQLTAMDLLPQAIPEGD